jgi:hypothetical protein
MQPFKGGQILNSKSTKSTTVIETEQGVYVAAGTSFIQVPILREEKIESLTRKVSKAKKSQAQSGRTSDTQASEGEDDQEVIAKKDADSVADQPKRENSELGLLESDSDGIWITKTNTVVAFAKQGSVRDLTGTVLSKAKGFSVLATSGKSLWLLNANGKILEANESGTVAELEIPSLYQKRLLTKLLRTNADTVWMIGQDFVLQLLKGVARQVLDYSSQTENESRALGKSLLGPDSALWVIEKHGNTIYRFDPVKGTPTERLLSDAATDILEVSGDVVVGTQGDGLLKYRGGVWKEFSKRNGNFPTNDVRDIAAGAMGTLVVALGESGVAILDGDTTTHLQYASAGLRVRNVVRVQDVGTLGFLLYGKDNNVQFLHGSEFSDSISFPGGIIATSDTRDGSFWLSGLSQFYRYNWGIWREFKIDGLARPFVRQVIRIAPDQYAFDSPEAGLKVYIRPKFNLKIDEIVKSTRTVTLSLSGSPNERLHNATLSYRFSVKSSEDVLWQTTSFQNGKATISAPLSVGDSAYLYARAESEEGDLYVLQDGVDGSGTPLHFPKETRGTGSAPLEIWNAAVGVAPRIIAIHASIWLLLIFVYPYSPSLQGAVFWNRSVRRGLTLWYIDFMMAAVPFIRARLIAPFRNQLTADARLELLDNYYKDIQLTWPSNQESRITPVQLASTFRGQILIRGPSGAGKSHLLRYLISQRKRACAFIAARSCEKGVVNAIQAKLPSQLKDIGMIEMLIYTGSLDVYIDGLNEVGSEVRENIRLFCVEYQNANIILTSQRFRVALPSSTKIMDIAPLENSQVGDYLYQVGPKTEIFDSAVRQYLKQQEISGGAQNAVSRPTNPYDLSITARLLALGVMPKSFHVQEQHFEYIVSRFKQESGNEFSILPLAKLAYEAKVLDSRSIGIADIPVAQMDLLLEEKVVTREIDREGFVVFRHDKIQDYLVTQYLLSVRDLQLRYLNDIRFIGVYTLLAETLPEADAKLLLSQLAVSATAVRDSTILYEFVERLRSLDRLGSAERARELTI